MTGAVGFQDTITFPLRWSSTADSTPGDSCDGASTRISRPVSTASSMARYVRSMTSPGAVRNPIHRDPATWPNVARQTSFCRWMTKPSVALTTTTDASMRPSTPQMVADGRRSPHSRVARTCATYRGTDSAPFATFLQSISSIGDIARGGPST
jgi:hypothetical protein